MALSDEVSTMLTRAERGSGGRLEVGALRAVALGLIDAGASDQERLRAKEASESLNKRIKGNEGGAS